MTFSEIIRNKFFWIYDFFRNSVIRSNLNEIKFSFKEFSENSLYYKGKLDNILKAK